MGEKCLQTDGEVTCFLHSVHWSDSVDLTANMKKMAIGINSINIQAIISLRYAFLPLDATMGAFTPFRLLNADVDITQGQLLAGFRRQNDFTSHIL